MWFLKTFTQVSTEILTTVCNCPTGGCSENCRGGRVVEIPAYIKLVIWIWLKDYSVVQPWTPFSNHIADVPFKPP